MATESTDRLHETQDGHVTDAFAGEMLGLAEAFPSTGKLTEERIRVYARLLGDLPIATVRAACVAAGRDAGRRFFPSASELRGYVQSSVDDAALVAWSALAQAAEDLGAYVDVQLDDVAAAGALVAVFGTWPAYCELPDRELAPKRAEFVAAYRTQARLDAGRGVATVRGLCGEATRWRMQGRVLRSGAVLSPSLVQYRAGLPAMPAEVEPIERRGE